MLVCPVLRGINLSWIPGSPPSRSPPSTAAQKYIERESATDGINRLDGLDNSETLCRSIFDRHARPDQTWEALNVHFANVHFCF